MEKERGEGGLKKPSDLDGCLIRGKREEKKVVWNMESVVLF
jgi:hypothetical protein